MADIHFFDINIAKLYGIAEAVLLQNIRFWVLKNKANNRHFHDGRYWTYNSSKAFTEQFPYLSQSQISRLIVKLKEEELILTGNYNENKLDRTLWYTLTEKAENLFGGNEKTISQNCESHFTKSQNPFDENERPIPYRNITDGNTDNKPYKSDSGEKLDDDEIKLPAPAEATQEEAPILLEEEKPKRKRKQKPKEEVPKIQYDDFVRMTEAEYDKLLKRLGSEEAVRKCIDILNNHKGATGQNYNSDYHAILKWVIDKYNRDMAINSKMLAPKNNVNKAAGNVMAKYMELTGYA